MIGRSDLPTVCLQLMADAVGSGEPLKLLVGLMPRLSRECRSAARAALAALSIVDMSPYQQRVTDAAVTAVAAACPRLASLVLCGCRKITDAAVMAVAAACPQLASLDLEYCGKITDAAVTSVAAARPPLASLDLGFCGQAGAR